MKRNIRSLTGIRGIAAVWVVLYHMQDSGQLEPRLSWLTNISMFQEGFRGVDLFFVLSGFIIMLVHKSDFVRLDWKLTVRYLEMRFWRVYPLNAAVLILVMILFAAAPAFSNLGDVSAAAIVQSFLLAQRWFIPDFGSINGPTWSLSVEILGYAAFPIIAYALNRVSSRWVLLLIALLCLVSLIVASLVLGFATHNVTGRLTIIRMFPAFAAGAALAAFYALRTDSAHSRAWMGGHLATASFAIWLAVCSLPTLAFLAVLPIAGLILGLASEEGLVNRLMASKIVVWLGQISFSLYLTNYVALGFLVWLPGGAVERPGLAMSIAYTGVVLTTLLAAAAATYYLVERPLAQFGRNIMLSRHNGLRPESPRVT